MNALSVLRRSEVFGVFQTTFVLILAQSQVDQSFLRLSKDQKNGSRTHQKNSRGKNIFIIAL